MVRSGWLERGAGPDERRGTEPFVPVDWETATRLLASELARVYAASGPEGVYGGSYGWASAGRFHHSQSQMHRFLNCLGGYVGSVNTYSHAAGEVILDRVAGHMRGMLARATAWSVIAAETDLVVCFGGILLKNTDVSPGGITRHTVRDRMRDAAAAGTRFVLFSPLRDDLPDFVDAEWHPIIPGADVAVMLGLAHTLVTEGLHDRAFLDRCCVGFDRFERYLLGQDDGVPKDAAWAAARCGVDAETIRGLARRMSSGRTLINVSWALQRAEHGEQAPWMGLVLAAILGQIGLPGGGFGFGYGSMGYVGEGPLPVGLPTFPQGRNPVSAFIPCARIADMLLNPGEPFDYNGQRLTYPDVDLVYWCGGNPFHHQSDLRRLRTALARPDTVVVHDPFWTGMARHADIVLPATMSLERNDIGAHGSDPFLVAMHRAVAPNAEARDDFSIFAGLAQALDIEPAFTEGRDEEGWLRHLYDEWRERARAGGVKAPAFDEFWATGFLPLPHVARDLVLFADFRADPGANPLATPSGRIEIHSMTIEGFGYDDCPGHPTWLEPSEWLLGPAAAHFPIQLIANNPRTRLHSQLDVGAFSQSSKVGGREPVRLHPADAAARGIDDGDIVRLFNERGSCLAGAVLSDVVRSGVAQLSTGAWYDPLDPADPASMCVHGNPNVLTRDVGTSKLAQGCTGQRAMVQIERWDGPVLPVQAHDPPPQRP
jgi:biotin/methionine sulfoxide reductase